MRFLLSLKVSNPLFISIMDTLDIRCWLLGTLVHCHYYGYPWLHDGAQFLGWTDTENFIGILVVILFWYENTTCFGYWQTAGLTYQAWKLISLLYNHYATCQSMLNLVAQNANPYKHSWTSIWTFVCWWMLNLLS